jgi:LDH2 family malate/lactate/ureidoglycolate dehydrogenase
MPTEPSDRIHMTVTEARALSEQALAGLGYDAEEARIVADHVIDAALCGYEYSGLPKILNIPDNPYFKAPRRPIRTVRETSVSLLIDGGNNVGMLALYRATAAAIDRAQRHGFALVCLYDSWMSGRSAANWRRPWPASRRSITAWPPLRGACASAASRPRTTAPSVS